MYWASRPAVRTAACWVPPSVAQRAAPWAMPTVTMTAATTEAIIARSVMTATPTSTNTSAARAITRNTGTTSTANSQLLGHLLAHQRPDQQVAGIQQVTPAPQRPDAQCQPTAQQGQPQQRRHCTNQHTHPGEGLKLSRVGPQCW